MEDKRNYQHYQPPLFQSLFDKQKQQQEQLKSPSQVSSAASTVVLHQPTPKKQIDNQQLLLQYGTIPKPQPTTVSYQAKSSNTNDKSSQNMSSSHKLANPDIFQTDFISYIIGPPGCGKTTLVNELLGNSFCYGESYFDDVLFISPGKFSPMQCDEPDNPGGNWWKKIDIRGIYQKIQEVNNKFQGTNIIPRICIIMDDVISQFKDFEKDDMFNALFLNKRHLLVNGGDISYIIISQKYNLLPLRFRINLTSVFIFYACQKEWLGIKDEVIKYHNPKMIYNLIQEQCKGTHKFVYIHNTNPIHVYDSNFKEFYLI